MTSFNRRSLILGGAACGLLIAQPMRVLARAQAFDLAPHPTRDQSEALQKAIDATSERRVALSLPAGVFRVSNLVLRPHTTIIGSGSTVLLFSGSSPLMSANSASHIRLEHLVCDGARVSLEASRYDALIHLTGCPSLYMSHVTLKSVRGGHALSLRQSGGHINNCTINDCSHAAILSENAADLTLSHNIIEDCADNGILIWRTAAGFDGTIITHNRIRRIKNVSGGSGQWGNGINIFRANDVSVNNNQFDDCAYTAVRANAASYTQIQSNHIRRMGEVAIFAELTVGKANHGGLKTESTIISNNIIEEAATGISATNFDYGGRLAAIQGNIIRKLTRREFEPVDQCGYGIHVEADCVVSNNMIENAQTAGILIGWGPYMRDVIASNNLIRESTVGIAITHDIKAGRATINNNMISGSRNGAIRLNDYKRYVGADLSAPNTTPPANITLVGNVAR